MTDNELLLAISDIIDKKLKPIEDSIKRLELTNENDILPWLENIILKESLFRMCCSPIDIHISY